MDSPGFKWLRSKLVTFMVVYWGAIIVLTYTLEWVGRHAPAFTVASLIVAVGMVGWLVVRWRRRQYW